MVEVALEEHGLYRVLVAWEPVAGERGVLETVVALEPKALKLVA